MLRCVDVYQVIPGAGRLESVLGSAINASSSQLRSDSTFAKLSTEMPGAVSDHRLSSPAASYADRALGCLFGGAVGDALGT